MAIRRQSVVLGVLLAVFGLVLGGVLVYMSLRDSYTVSGGSRRLLLPIAFSIARRSPISSCGSRSSNANCTGSGPSARRG